MKAEAQEAANKALDKYAARIKQIAKITPERVIREGDTADEIVKLIDEDADIGILVLAAGTGKEGPGPLVADLAKTAGTFPIPVAIVPGHLQRRRPRYDGLAYDPEKWEPVFGQDHAPKGAVAGRRRSAHLCYKRSKPVGLEPAWMRRERCLSRPNPRPIRRR